MNRAETNSGELLIDASTAGALPADRANNVTASINPVPAVVITPLLIAACVVVFCAMKLLPMPHGLMASQRSTLWGANFGPLTLGGQPWRLFTSVFVHLGWLHLAVNMWCLWDLGSFAERLYGRTMFLTIYLTTGIAGSLLSLLWHPFSVEAGASGAVFGIAGALIASFCLGDHPFPRHAMKAVLLSVLAFAGYNLFVGIFNGGAGNAAHIGGLVSGLLVGALLAWTSARWMVVAAAACSLVLGYGLIVRAEGYIVPAERGRTLLAAGQSKQAIGDLNESVRKNPDFAEGFSLLGQAYLQQQQFPAAEQSFRRSLALQPAANDVRYQLAMVLLAERRAKDSIAAFAEIVKRDPANASARIGMGTAAAMNGNFELALQAFQSAAKLDPANPQVYAGIGVAAMQLNEPDIAVAALMKQVDIEPDNANALLQLALAYKAKGMQKDAQQTYERALALAASKK